MKKTKYFLSKKKIKNVIVNFSSVIDGYCVKPKNKMTYDGIVVKSMFIYNKELIQNLLKKKIRKKLDGYLNFMISVLDDDDTDSGHLMFALNDLDRYRRLVINNYRMYLEKKYFQILMNKMDLIEKELRSKIRIDINQLFAEQMELSFDEPQNQRKR
jgi:hypothetical protein